MAARKSAAQKAAEAAERDEYTGKDEASTQDDNLTAVVDEKGKKLTIQQLKNKLRNEAEREVLDTHKDEVIKITAAKYKVHNLDYVRRLSEEEKAAKAIEEYYVKFPKLRPQLQQQQAQREIVNDTVPPVVTYADAVPFTSEYEPVTRESIEDGFEQESPGYREVEAREGE